jgi:hypothetical protein
LAVGDIRTLEMQGHSEDHLSSSSSGILRRSLSLRQAFLSRHSSQLGRKSSTASTSSSSLTRSSSVYAPSGRSVMEHPTSPQLYRHSVFSVDSMRSSEETSRHHYNGKPEKRLSRPPSIITSQTHPRLSQDSFSSSSSHYEPYPGLASPVSNSSTNSSSNLQPRPNGNGHPLRSPMAMSHLPPMSNVWLDDEDSDEERLNSRHHKNSAISFSNLRRLARTKDQQGLVVGVDCGNGGEVQLNPVSSHLSS